MTTMFQTDLEAPARTIEVWAGCDHTLTRAEEAVIASPPFQRLRRLRQMGLAFHAWPNAENTRASHSLGVAYWSARYLDALRRSDDPTTEAGLAAAAKQLDGLSLDVVLRLFGLLHDIDLLPLGHTLRYQSGLFAEPPGRPRLWACVEAIKAAAGLPAFGAHLDAAAGILDGGWPHTAARGAGQLRAGRRSGRLRPARLLRHHPAPGVPRRPGRGAASGEPIRAGAWPSTSPTRRGRRLASPSWTTSTWPATRSSPRRSSTRSSWPPTPCSIWPCAGWAPPGAPSSLPEERVRGAGRRRAAARRWPPFEPVIDPPAAAGDLHDGGVAHRGPRRLPPAAGVGTGPEPRPGVARRGRGSTHRRAGVGRAGRCDRRRVGAGHAGQAGERPLPRRRGRGRSPWPRRRRTASMSGPARPRPATRDFGRCGSTCRRRRRANAGRGGRLRHRRLLGT